MSYCRFSSNNWNCDIYAYESCMGGWEVHVAANRIVGNIPKVDYGLIKDGEYEKFSKQHKAQMEFLRNCKRKEIGLSMDGESFNCPTLIDFKQKMIELREAGYNFPDYVLEDIEYEISN